MSLSSAVELYRLINRPGIESGAFSGQLEYTPDVIQILEPLWRKTNSWFEYLNIDGNLIWDNDTLPDTGAVVFFKIRIPTNSENSFHESFSSLLHRTPSISRGQEPKHFYIVNKDYFNPEDEAPSEMSSINVICRMIRKLSDLAHYHDHKAPSGGHLKLVFMPPGDEHSRPPVVIETRVDESFLDLSLPNISMLDELSCGPGSCDPHISAKIDVFRTSLFEFMRPGIAQTSNAFKYLIENWGGFIDLFQKNMGTYLSGFAFHKAKKEVAEAEFYIAEQFSKIIGEIAGKLLIIPVSFTVVIAVARSSGLLEGTVLWGGLLIAAIIIDGAVANQQLQLDRISHAKDMVLNALEGKEEAYPKELQAALRQMKKMLNRNGVKLRSTLKLFRAVSWIPAAAGLGLLLYKHWQAFVFSL